MVRTAVSIHHTEKMLIKKITKEELEKLKENLEMKDWMFEEIRQWFLVERGVLLKMKKRK